MLTSAWKPLKYHAKQAALWRSRARFVAVAAGRGSGKTELARRRIVRYLAVHKSWPNPMYAYTLPTHKQARRVAWKPILDLIPPDWIKGEPNVSEMRIETKFGSTLYVQGLDKPQRIEGDQWDGIVMDESCDQRPGAFARSILPALTHRNGWCWRIGVPKRTGVGAQEFKDFFFSESSLDKESYTWSSEDILSYEQYKWFKENLDAKDYNEQFRASWETATGLVFHAYDEVLNGRVQPYDPKKPLIIGSDFNVDPMAWVIAQQSDDKQEIYFIDELWLRNTNTKEALAVLHSKYGRHEGGFDFFGDATSRARNTRASESDYVQIKNDRRFRGARVHYPKHNPKISNRVAACNAMLCNAEGRRRCFISHVCKNLIRDLQIRAYEPGTTIIDDDGDVGHITDAFGYVIYKLYPLLLDSPAGSQGVYVNVA